MAKLIYKHTTNQGRNKTPRAHVGPRNYHAQSLPFFKINKLLTKKTFGRQSTIDMLLRFIYPSVFKLVFLKQKKYIKKHQTIMRRAESKLETDIVPLLKDHPSS